MLSLQRTIVVFVILFVANSAPCQTPKPPAAPKIKAEQVPGYTPMLIEGFTILVSDETMQHKDDPKYAKKPLEVLEQELKIIVSMMPARSVGILRGVFIWVDWDKSVAMANGRAGSALAVYYGGHQLNMMAKGMHPLRAKNVSVLRMKSLTAEHQPDRDSGRCVLLHEIAHAVHDQVIGREHPAVKAAYRQAMERKLLADDSYAATNEAEFFAEMSCAFYDQLEYHPKTRSALVKHDPVTAKVMEAVWGKTAKGLSTPTKNVATTVEAPALDKLDLGRIALHGVRPRAADFEGNPTILLFWNEDGASPRMALSKVQAWHGELADFGLAGAAVHLAGVGQGTPMIEDDRKVGALPITAGPWSGRESVVAKFKDFPVCLVYDHEGRCVFRGSPFEAEDRLRSAVGTAVVAAAGIESSPKQLQSIIDNLEKGKAPKTQFASLTPLTKSKDDAISASAKMLLDALTERGRAVLESTEPKVKDEPLDAFLTLERLASAFKDTFVATRANELIAKLKSTKVVAMELKARPALTIIKKIETELSVKPGSFDPASARYRRDNAILLKQLEVSVQQMRRLHPEARATEDAERIARRFFVSGS